MNVVDADRGRDARPRLPAGDGEGDPDPRPHGRPARAPGRGAGAAGRLPAWPGRAEEAIAYERQPDAGPADARARGRGASVGRAARDRRRELPRAARLPLRALGVLPREARGGRVRLGARRPGGLADIARLPLTEKRELKATTHAATTRSARTSAPRRDEIVRIYSTSGTTGTPSYIPLTARRPRQLGDGLGAQLRARPASPPASGSSRPTTPGRSSRARRSPRSTASASATSRSAPATPSG